MLSSYNSIDEMFDLDMALTMPEDYSTVGELNKHQRDALSMAEVRDLVGEMPTVVVGGDGGRCTVCMEGFQLGGAGGKKVPCGHVFHENCISQWLSVHDSCPLCRGIVSGAGKVVL